MSHHPYEDLYEDYQEETEEQQAPPPRHGKRPKLHSVPLRTMRTAQWQTGDDITMLFPELHTRQGQGQPQRPRPARQTEQRQTQAAPAAQKSHIPHTALQSAASQDRRVGKSQINYTDEYGRQVWRQGNKEVVFQEVEPPRRRFHLPRLHWLFYVSLGVVLTVALVIGWNVAAATIQANSLNSTYGMPRTWQTDAVVGHEDSPSHRSHFIFENLHGHIIITEYPGGNTAHAHIYNAGVVYDEQAPVTGAFQDVNHDGKPDMLVQIGTGTSTTQTFTLVNNGTVFVVPS